MTLSWSYQLPQFPALNPPGWENHNQTKHHGKTLCGKYKGHTKVGIKKPPQEATREISRIFGEMKTFLWKTTGKTHVGCLFYLAPRRARGFIHITFSIISQEGCKAVKIQREKVFCIKIILINVPQGHVAQSVSVRFLVSAQATISQFMSPSPGSGSARGVQGVCLGSPLSSPPLLSK